MTLSDKRREQMTRDAAPVLMEGETVVDLTTGNAAVTRMGTSTRRRGDDLGHRSPRRDLLEEARWLRRSGLRVRLAHGGRHKKGVFGGHLTLRAAGDSADVQQVDKDDVERISQVIRDRMALARQPQEPSQGSAGSVADELAKLAGLRDAGVLTAAEFDAQKAKILGGL